MTESRARSRNERDSSGSNVESPKVADHQGGWAGRETAGHASTQDHSGDVREWARTWAETFPAWSDEQWRQANAALGYRLAESSAEAARERAA